MRTEPNHTLDLDQISKLWRRRRWLATATFIICFAATCSMAASLPSLYRATAAVVIDRADGPESGSSSNALITRLDSVSQEVLSRSNLDPVIARFDLYPGWRQRVSEQTLLDRMQRDIQVDRKTAEQQWGQTATIGFTVSYQGWDPQQVTQVTNMLAALFVNENSKLGAHEASDTAATLKQKLGDIKLKLDAQERQINTFKSSHLGELPEQQEANLATLQQLNAQLQINSENQIHAMERREELLKQLTASGGADLAQLQQQLADLRTRFTDKYPDVIRVKAEIAALTQQRKGDAGSDSAANSLQTQLNQVQAEIKSLGQQERQLHNQIAVYQSHVENVPRLTQQLQTLTQGYEETKEIYSSLLKRYEEASIARSGSYQGSDNQFHILDAAVVPKDAVGPNRLRLILLGTLLSLALAAGAIFLAEQLDTSFHTVEELQVFTKIPVLARIPRIDTAGDKLRRRWRFGVLTLSTTMIFLVAVEIAAVIGRNNQVLVWMLTKHSS